MIPSNVTVTTAQSTVMSLTVPQDGKWMVILSGFAQNATEGGYFRPYIYVDSNQVLDQALEASSTNRKNIGQTYVGDFSEGTVISLRMQADSGTYDVRKGARLSLLRVG